jgi:hypothetical protein
MPAFGYREKTTTLPGCFHAKRTAGSANGGNGSQRNVPVTLYCSLMERTVATASAIAESCQLPLHGYRDIHEVGGVYLKNDETGERVGMPGHGKQFFTEHYPLLKYPEGVDADGWCNRSHEAREERPARCPACVGGYSYPS